MAKHRQISDDLRRAINAGRLEPGAQLPSEAELGTRYGASRTTVRQALATLANEGLITSAAGRGSFVRDRVSLTFHAALAESADRPPSETDAYFDEVRATGREPSQRFEMRIEPAAEEVATRLNISLGDLAVLRRCLRYVDGEAWSDQLSWYPMDIAQEAGLVAPDDIPGGTIRAMAEAGHVEVGHVDELTARMPTPDESRTLDIGIGTPVMVYVRIAYTRERPVRVTKTIFPADRNRIVYEFGDLAALVGDDTR